MDQKIRLFSKRNQVYRMKSDDQLWIRKHFEDPGKMACEVAVLKRLKASGCQVPKILKVEDNYLDLEDLGDQTLLEWYEEMERLGSDHYTEMLLQLVKWLQCFYAGMIGFSSFQLSHGDLNFRNFVIRKGELYGIDFENVGPGSFLEDVGQLIAFALLYEPQMTPWKMRFCEEALTLFAYNMNVSEEQLFIQRDRALEELQARRNHKIKRI